jgi:hypothetical protein
MIKLQIKYHFARANFRIQVYVYVITERLLNCCLEVQESGFKDVGRKLRIVLYHVGNLRA